VTNHRISIPVQRYTQHHVEKYPNHIDHLGQTKEDHTSDLHEELLGHGQSYGCYRVSQWTAITHHASKIFLTQPVERQNARMSISLGRHVNHSGQGLKEAHNIYQCCQGEVVK
jgi:hypothetical protein